MGVKRPGREADNSPPSTAEATNAWSYFLQSPNMLVVWCLVRHRDILPFYLYSYVGIDPAQLPSV
jgi:hypothetical protein